MHLDISSFMYVYFSLLWFSLLYSFWLLPLLIHIYVAASAYYYHLLCLVIFWWYFWNKKRTTAWALSEDESFLIEFLSLSKFHFSEISLQGLLSQHSIFRKLSFGIFSFSLYIIFELSAASRLYTSQIPLTGCMLPHRQVMPSRPSLPLKKPCTKCIDIIFFIWFLIEQLLSLIVLSLIWYHYFRLLRAGFLIIYAALHTYTLITAASSFHSAISFRPTQLILSLLLLILTGNFYFSHAYFTHIDFRALYRARHFPKYSQKALIIYMLSAQLRTSLPPYKVTAQMIFWEH